MRAVEAEYKCRLHKLTLTDTRTDTRTEPGVSREAPPLKIFNFQKHLLEVLIFSGRASLETPGSECLRI